LENYSAAAVLAIIKCTRSPSVSSIMSLQRYIPITIIDDGTPIQQAKIMMANTENEKSSINTG
jgi:hypothetical protein